MLVSALLVLVPGVQEKVAPDPFAPPPTAEMLGEAVQRALELLVEAQEGDGPSEWPYEGVYRVDGRIPIGYRVGGTALVARTLAEAPGWGSDAARRAAVGRGLRFVIDAREHELMDPDYGGGYDVRVWGHACALHTLARLSRLERLPDALAAPAAEALPDFVAGVERTQIPMVGGWNYARAEGLDTPGRGSPFMTAVCLQALFEARAAGLDVDADVVARGLDFLARSRLPSGSVAYALEHEAAPNGNGVPGATGRMLAVESTLLLAGRGSPSAVRGALDAFLAHWPWLDARRAQPGTHARPYGVAPYYFYFAHDQAGRAVELLPPEERPEYRRRVLERLFQVRLEDGSWNDRVFPRSATYGTAMALGVLLAPDLAPPAGW